MSFVRVPPDGAGKKVFSKTHTVGSDQVEVQGVHLVDSKDPSHQLSIDVRGAASVRFSEGQPSLSGFGALNVSQKRVLGVYESSSGSYDDLFSVQIAGAGSNTYDDDGHSMVLGVDGAQGSSVKRTTNRYHYYLPGSSNLVIMTIAASDSGKVGNSRRWGAFDDNDGVFFELMGTELYAVIRSSTTGSVVNSRVARADWNLDKLDGTGFSGHTLDLTKVNLWWIDYQWLGAGRVRFGVYLPDGSRVVCHQFENAGTNTLPYMRSGTLPLRTENVNTSATGSTTELRECCMSIYTEGTHEDYTFWRKADVDASGSAGSTESALVVIRSKATVPGLNHHNSIVAYPETLNIFTDQPVRIDLHQDVTVSGATWGVTQVESSIEASLDATVSTNGPAFKTWFFPAGAHSVSLTEFFEVNDEGVMLNADGTAETWAFTMKRLGATDANVVMNLGYRELW